MGRKLTHALREIAWQVHRCESWPSGAVPRHLGGTAGHTARRVWNILWHHVVGAWRINERGRSGMITGLRWIRRGRLVWILRHFSHGRVAWPCNSVAFSRRAYGCGTSTTITNTIAQTTKTPAASGRACPSVKTLEKNCCFRREFDARVAYRNMPHEWWNTAVSVRRITAKWAAKRTSGKKTLGHCRWWRSWRL